MIQTEKYGYWQVEGQKFLSKYDALVYATNHKKNVKFYYHNNVWASFDRTKLGKVSLQELYRQRAQQLRDTYDYLILYYSGGADSHNILRTFIDNNIKLDEICVKWPKQLIDGNFYTPNTADTSARNYWSEWNYAVKPTLEWISTHKNDIKITIKDYAESIDKLNIDNIISKLNFIRGGGILLNSVTSNSEIVITDKNKKVAHIYGIDKPLLYIKDTRVYMFFSDVCLDQAGRGDIDPTSTECFYWTPDFPELPFEQSYQLSLYYKNNPEMKKFLWDDILKTPEEKNIANQFQTDLARSLLYSNWDHRFQADKPNSASRTDKFFWFYEHPELADLRNRYFYSIKSRTNMIDDIFLTPKSTSGPSVYNVTVSKNFFVTDIQ
jgi:hypothetical protein